MDHLAANDHDAAFGRCLARYQRTYRRAGRSLCEHAIRDIEKTLPLHDRGAYTGKLEAELAAARGRLEQLRATR